ncbi:hypothetical protein TUBRATIS_26810 [Tubulinosema ratisbonensis]|uniref:Uncharacterized protein n=1 Tax=Tubulinosema ratisbonensis TaxID=291195 RepID=A0A437AIJ5_9MICR|nr:hypothetical protein TUBRATIS_26810 [Tubulinosema ratisbonensis]
MYHQRKNFKNIFQHLFIIASILQPCLGSLEVINEFEIDRSLDDRIVQDNPESLQDDFTHCDFLLDSYDLTRMLGYARLLRYKARKSISNIKHTIAKKLYILFHFISESNNDTNKVHKTIKELYELLENEENRKRTHEDKTRHYFADILIKLRDSLSHSIGETVFENYMRYLFLRENCVFLKDSGWKNHSCHSLNPIKCITIKMLLGQLPAHLNVFKSMNNFDSLYPKYLYFNVSRDGETKVRLLNLERECIYRYTDQNKICFYKLVGVLTEEFNCVNCYLKENGKWNRYICNQKMEERKLIHIPFAAVFEKFAEYNRNLSERIKD